MLTNKFFWILFAFVTLAIAGSIYEANGYWTLLLAPVGGALVSGVLWFIGEKVRERTG